MQNNIERILAALRSALRNSVRTTAKARVPIFALALLSACTAAVPLASGSADKAAKQFAVKPGLANIYVYRNEAVGKAVKMQVLIDGVVVGQTAYKTFIVRQVHPGRHTVVSRTESDSTLSITAEAGSNYFVWQEVKAGVMRASSQLQLMEDDQGKRDVKKCKLVG